MENTVRRYAPPPPPVLYGVYTVPYNTYLWIFQLHISMLLDLNSAHQNKCAKWDGQVRERMTKGQAGSTNW